MSDQDLSLKLLEVYPAPTVIHDYKNFVYVNNAAVKKFRANSKSDLIGKPILDFVHPSSVQETIESLQSPERNDTFEMHDLHLLAQDGSSFYSDIVGTSITIDGKECVHLLINDITQLRNSEQRYRSLYELAPEAILLEDEEGFILDANPAFFKLLGYSREETIGQHVQFLTLDKDLELIREDIKKVISGEVLMQEAFGRCKNGKIITVQLTESAFPLENNKIGLIAIMADITAIKKHESELILAKEKAEEMSRLKSSFLANMSHELRTPMIGILGYSDLLSEDEFNPTVIEYARVIHQSAKRLMDTLNLILDLSKIEADRLDILEMECDACEIVTESFNLFISEAEKKELNFELLKPQQSIPVLIDERIFTHICINLINNAIKFTQKGSVIIEVKLNESATGSNLVLRVIDTGIGIAKQDQELIFDEFRQVSEGFGRSFEGTGLGLTVTKKFVEKLKGEIHLESESGVGTIFTVIIPNNLHKTKEVNI